MHAIEIKKATYNQELNTIELPQVPNFKDISKHGFRLIILPLEKEINMTSNAEKYKTILEAYEDAKNSNTTYTSTKALFNDLGI